MNPEKPNSNYKIVIEIEPDFDFSPVDQKEDLNSDSIKLVNDFIVQVSKDPEAIKQIFVSDTLDCLSEYGKFMKKNEDIKKLWEIYPREYNDVFLRLADASNDFETQYLIYCIFSHTHDLLMNEYQRIKYINFFSERFLKKKISVSLVDNVE